MGIIFVLSLQLTMLYHTPRTLKQDEPGPVLFFFDSNAYRSKVPTPVILDNLIAEKIPPLIAVFITNPSREVRASGLPCKADCAKFIANELLPWVEEQLGFETLTSQALLSGSSYGGLHQRAWFFSIWENLAWFRVSRVLLGWDSNSVQ